MGVGLGVQGRCEQRREVFQRSEVFVKIKKKMCGGGGGGRFGRGGQVVEGQGGCE